MTLEDPEARLASISRSCNIRRLPVVCASAGFESKFSKRVGREVGREQIEIEEAFALVDGVRVHYQRAGAGRPLLLLHGLVGSAKNWRQNISFLARNSCVYAIDLFNMGESERVRSLILFAPANPFCDLGHQLIRFYQTRMGNCFARLIPWLPRMLKATALTGCMAIRRGFRRARLKGTSRG